VTGAISDDVITYRRQFTGNQQLATSLQLANVSLGLNGSIVEIPFVPADGGDFSEA